MTKHCENLAEIGVLEADKVRWPNRLTFFDGCSTSPASAGAVVPCNLADRRELGGAVLDLGGILYTDYLAVVVIVMGCDGIERKEGDRG